MESAERKSNELYSLAQSLKTFPERWHIEPNLHGLNNKYRFILFKSTSKAVVKIVYYVDKKNSTVYVTDFFPTSMDDKKIQSRN